MIKSLKFIVISSILSIIFLIILGALNLRINSSYGISPLFLINIFEFVIDSDFILGIISLISSLILTKNLINKEKINYIEVFILTTFVLCICHYLYIYQLRVAELIGYKPYIFNDIHEINGLNMIEPSLKEYINFFLSDLPFYVLISLIIQMILKFSSYILCLNKNNKNLI